MTYRAYIKNIDFLRSAIATLARTEILAKKMESGLCGTLKWHCTRKPWVVANENTSSTSRPAHNNTHAQRWGNADWEIEILTNGYEFSKERDSNVALKK